jgi:hypothetical protein
VRAAPLNHDHPNDIDSVVRKLEYVLRIGQVPALVFPVISEDQTTVKYLQQHFDHYHRTNKHICVPQDLVFMITNMNWFRESYQVTLDYQNQPEPLTRLPIVDPFQISSEPPATMADPK